MGSSGRGETLYSLKLLSPGELVEIVQIASDCCLCRKLRDLGFREGAIVEIQNRDPFTGKIIVRVNDSFIAIDERLGGKVLVRPIVERYRELRELLYYDNLTGCYRRDCTERLLERLVFHSPCSLALADLDNFKQINDTYGHTCGDLVLKEVGSLLKKSVRRQDFVVRWGGEEFLLFFTKAPLDLARNICERVRRAVENLLISYEDCQIKVTLSIGLCGVPPPRNLRELIDEADRALYRAKQQGKNRVVSCEW